MERLGTWALGGLIIGSAFLPQSVPNSFSFERPVHLAITLLVSLSISTIALGSRLLRLAGDSTDPNYLAVPLDELHVTQSSRESPTSTQGVGDVPSLRKQRLYFVALVLAICARVEIFRRIVRNIQCSGPSYSAVLPFAFAVLDFFFVQKHRSVPIRDELDDGFFDVIEQHLTTTRYRYVVSTAFLGLSSSIVSRLATGPGSTYICPATSGLGSVIPGLQHLGLGMDFCILYCIDRVIKAHVHANERKAPGRSLTTLGWALCASGIILCIVSFIYFLLVPEERHWIYSISMTYIWSVFKLNLVLGAAAIFALLSVLSHGLLTTLITASFTGASVTAISWSWHNVNPFPPAQTGWSYLFFCTLLLAFATYWSARILSGDLSSAMYKSSVRTVPGTLYGVLLVLFTLSTAQFFWHRSAATYHPIDMLMFDANARHDAYVQQASTSQDLTSAVAEYQRRYKRNPPPGFKAWHEFATLRNCTVIDDYDAMTNDIGLYWDFRPDLIRHRTWELISNPFNDVAGISIRNGKAEISPNVVPTHRWMLDGVIQMIDKFGTSLPDMDLGFNVNDECRVAVPFKWKEAMLQRLSLARDSTDRPMSNHYSPGRAEQWRAIPVDPIEDTPFQHLSFHRTFQKFGNVACPPSSPARSRRHWDVSQLCTECVEQHSLGVFLANWTLSGNICHQPDMADLHGFYLSPAAFKATEDLYPVFSQSRVHGYNDILYPSAWNYMDKARYAPTDENPDPAYADKKHVLFWRGATSEGVSPGSGTWKGMTRQRFVHMANNINGSTRPQAVLLPEKGSSGKLSYALLPAAELTSLLPTDVHFVDNIVRCGGMDCSDQAAEFAPLLAPSDFQAHWAHKFLLDLDGAGFSGRFLPFLQSRSLPFKAALFREWYDDRMTPWLHFVPLDLRGHGFWATLMYFAGLEGRVKGRMVSVPARESEGERIASAGREWADKVLRKEDMEAYFFRLLLEWGRLTDDRREELGFVIGQ